MGIDLNKYIHYKYSNYLKFGITANSEQNFSPEDMMSAQRNRILNEAEAIYAGRDKGAMAKTIEEQINWFFKDGDKSVFKEGVDLTEELIKFFEESFGTDFKYDANLAAERVAVTDQNLSLKFSNLQNDAKFHRVSSITDRLGKVKEIILSKPNFYTQEQLDEYGARLEALEQEYKGLKIDGKRIFTENIAPREEGSDQNFITDLNQLIKDMKVASRAYIVGQMGELAPLLIQRLFFAKSEAEIKEIIENFLNGVKNGTVEGQTGFISTKAVIKQENLGVSLDRIADFSKSEMLEGGDLIALNATQDKVDIHIAFGEAEPIKANIKNYALHPGASITLLSGANPILYLQQYSDFLYHYLNITAKRSGGGSNVRANSGSAPIADANRTAMITLALKAIAGGVMKMQEGGASFSDQAEVFLVNDNKGGGGYKIIFIDDYINKIKENESTIKQFIKIEGWDESKTWPSVWQGEKFNSLRMGYSRNVQTLIAFQKQKIKASLSMAGLEALTGSGTS